MAIALDKMQFSLDRKQILTIAGAVVLLAAAGWAGWQYLEDTGPAPQPVTARQIGPATAAAPAGSAAAPKAAAPKAPAPPPPAADTPQAGAQTQAAKPASEAISPSTPPPLVQRHFAAADAPAMRRRAPRGRDQDLRKCLDLESNAAIARCAQQ